MAQLSLISWNVAGRVRRLTEQVAFLAGQAPDLVALQEVRAHTLSAWRRGLREAGIRQREHISALRQVLGLPEDV